MAQPSLFTQELADAFCAELAQGKSMKAVCEGDEFPTRKTIFCWLRTKPEFLAQYERAKRESADVLVDEITAIADDVTSDPNCRRIRMDARKWVASKLKPKAYGDKIALSGDDEGSPLVVSWLGAPQ